MAETDSSMRHVKETLHSPNDETDYNAVRLKETPATLERTDRLYHAVCNRNSHKRKTRHTSTGRVRKIPHQTNDETDSNAGRVRETPEPLNDETDCSTGRVRETVTLTNDETDCSTGRVRETAILTNDETDSSTGRVKETPHLRNDEAERTHIFHDGACKRNFPPTPDETHTSTGRVRETPHPPNDEKDNGKGRFG